MEVAMNKLMVVAVCAFALDASAMESQSRPMGFEQCLELIRNTATQLGVAPKNVVETSTVRIVRFVTSDGSVLVTCSRADQKVTITRSERR
jgi:hypothetical protein